MHRAGIGAVALLASWAAAQVTAEAQDIRPSVTAFQGRDGNFSIDQLGSDAGEIGLAECDSLITFTFTGVDSMRGELQFWEGSMCDLSSVRLNEDTTECEELPAASVDIDNRSMFGDVQVRVSDLLPEACTDRSGAGGRDIWVIALDSPNDDATGPGQKATFRLAFDFNPPSTPGSLQATGGENVATLTWGSGDSDASYQVFVDPTGCDSNGAVIADGPLTTDPPTLSPRTGTVTGGQTTVEFPDAVEFDQYMAVAIRAVDDSGNLGALSNVVCVQRFETTSWWDSRCGTGDGGGAGDELCRDDGGTCAATSARSSGAGLGTLLLIALAALVIRRRAR